MAQEPDKDLIQGASRNVETRRQMKMAADAALQKQEVEQQELTKAAADRMLSRGRQEAEQLSATREPGPVAGAGSLPSGTEEEMRLTSQALRQETEAMAAEDAEQFSQIERPEERPMTAGQAIVQALGGFATGFATAYTGKDYLNPYLTTMAEIRKDRRQRQQAIDSIFARINQGGEPVAALFAQMLGATTPEEFRDRLGSLSGEMAANLDREGIKLIAEQKAKDGTNEEQLLTATSLLASLEAQAAVYGLTPPNISEMNGKEAIIAANSFRGKIESLEAEEAKTVAKQQRDSQKVATALGAINPQDVARFENAGAFIADLMASLGDVQMSDSDIRLAEAKYSNSTREVNRLKAEAAITTGNLPQGEYASLDADAKTRLGTQYREDFARLQLIGATFDPDKLPEELAKFAGASSLDEFFMAGGQPEQFGAAAAWLNSPEGRKVTLTAEAFAPGGSARALEATVQTALEDTAFELQEDDVILMADGRVMLDPKSPLQGRLLASFSQRYAASDQIVVREALIEEAKGLGIPESFLAVEQALVEGAEQYTVEDTPTLGAPAPEDQAEAVGAVQLFPEERLESNITQTTASVDLSSAKLRRVNLPLFEDSVPMTDDEKVKAMELQATLDERRDLTPGRREKLQNDLNKLQLKEALTDSRVQGRGLLNGVGSLVIGRMYEDTQRRGVAGDIPEIITQLPRAKAGQKQPDDQKYIELFQQSFNATRGARLEDVPNDLFALLYEDSQSFADTQALRAQLFDKPELMAAYDKALDMIPDLEELRERMQKRVPKSYFSRTIGGEKGTRSEELEAPSAFEVDNQRLAVSLLGRQVGTHFGLAINPTSTDAKSLLAWEDMTDTEFKQAIAISFVLMSYGNAQ